MANPQTLARILNDYRGLRYAPCNLIGDKMDARYLAGFFDGEGHIGINVHNCRQKSGQNYIQIRPTIQIVNTDAGVVREIQDYLSKLGCKVSIYYRKSNSKWRTTYSLEIRKVDSIILFLEHIQDHLIIKKPQCELTLQFCQQRRDKLSIATRYRGYTPEQVELADKVRMLNGGKLTGGRPILSGELPRDNIKVSDVPSLKLPFDWN